MADRAGPQHQIKFKAEEFPRRLESEVQRVLVPAKNELLSWDFYVRLIPRSFDGFSGLGKHFSSNGSLTFSSEMHPRSGIQALYDPKGELIVKVEEYYVPPRKLWFPDTEKLQIVDENFDYQRRLTSWKWGDYSEAYHYTNGVMDELIIGKLFLSEV